MSFTFEPLARHHDRNAFDCGVPALDDFLRRHARQNQERNVSRTFVATRSDGLRVLGFHTLASGSIAFERLPEEARRRLPRYPVPVAHLGRLAVDRSVRGEGLGELLLFDAFKRIADAGQVLGIFAVEVIAKTERARDFYQKYGFKPLTGNSLNLYLPLGTILRSI